VALSFHSGPDPSPYTLQPPDLVGLAKAEPDAVAQAQPHRLGNWPRRNPEPDSCGLGGAARRHPLACAWVGGAGCHAPDRRLRTIVGHRLARSFHRICDKDKLRDIKAHHLRQTAATLRNNLGVRPATRRSFSATHGWPSRWRSTPRGPPGSAPRAWPHQ
jgi:hypothetical protein